ncbi:MAG: DUF1499 domain-containing protein [Longimicrobiaceae bacterium]
MNKPERQLVPRFRPRSRLALVGFGLGVGAVLGLALAGPGSQWGLWHFGTGFRIMRWSAYAGVAACAVSLLAMLRARPGGSKRGIVLGLVGFLFGLSAVLIPWRWQRLAEDVPRLHDVSTDTENPPEFRAVLPLREGAPNPPEYAGEEAAALQREEYPGVRPLAIALPPENVFPLLLREARGMGWRIVAADPVEGRIEATDQTPWFGFEDDVVVRVSAHQAGARVDVRSKSRVGASDVGTNARRVQEYLDRLRAALNLE